MPECRARRCRRCIPIDTVRPARHALHSCCSFSGSWRGACAVRRSAWSARCPVPRILRQTVSATTKEPLVMPATILSFLFAAGALGLGATSEPAKKQCNKAAPCLTQTNHGTGAARPCERYWRHLFLFAAGVWRRVRKRRHLCADRGPRQPDRYRAPRRGPKQRMREPAIRSMRHEARIHNKG